jgi:hypothetical protein
LISWALVLIVFIVGCGGPAGPPAASDRPATYKVGDTIEAQDHSLRVLSAAKNGDRLVVELQVHNTGTKPLAISPLLSFSARTTNGESLGYALGSGGLADGRVPAGEEIKGALTFRLPATADGVKLYYLPSLFGPSLFVVTLDETATNNPLPKPAEVEGARAFAKGSTYKVGEAVVLKGVVARLVSAEISEKVVRVQVVVYNGGARAIAIASIFSFGVTEVGGVKGVGKPVTDAPLLDGRLIPKDTLRGTVQWEFAAPPKGVTLTYADSNLFGDDVITWKLD